MNKPLISTGLALSALGLMAVDPAQAGTLTFDFEVDATSTVTVNPFLSGLTLGGNTVPNSLGVTADNVTGSFTVLDDPAQFTDGIVDLDSGLLDDVLGSSYDVMLDSLLGDYGLTSTQAVQLADNVFKIDQFTGGGVLESKDFSLVGNPSAFNIGYNSATNAAVIDGYSTEVAESCLSTTCLLDGNVSFGVSLVLSEFVSLTNDLLANSAVSLSSEATDAIANLQQIATLAQLFGPTLGLATVSSEFSATTNLASSDPAGTSLDGDVTDGVITATVTTGTQVEQLFSQSLASAPAPVEIPTVVAEPAVETVLAVVVAEPPISPTVVNPAVVVTAPPEDAQLPSQQPIVVEEAPVVFLAQPAIANPSVAADPGSSSGGSIIMTSSELTVTTNPVNGGNDAQDVPEPSIVVGLLGAAALVKRGRQKTVA